MPNWRPCWEDLWGTCRLGREGLLHMWLAMSAVGREDMRTRVCGRVERSWVVKAEDGNVLSCPQLLQGEVGGEEGSGRDSKPTQWDWPIFHLPSPYSPCVFNCSYTSISSSREWAACGQELCTSRSHSGDAVGNNSSIFRLQRKIWVWVLAPTVY